MRVEIGLFQASEAQAKQPRTSGELDDPSCLRKNAPEPGSHQVTDLLSVNKLWQTSSSSAYPTTSLSGLFNHLRSWVYTEQLSCLKIANTRREYIISVNKMVITHQPLRNCRNPTKNTWTFVQKTQSSIETGTTDVLSCGERGGHGGDFYTILCFSNKLQPNVSLLVQTVTLHCEESSCRWEKKNKKTADTSAAEQWKLSADWSTAAPTSKTHLLGGFLLVEMLKNSSVQLTIWGFFSFVLKAKITSSLIRMLTLKALRGDLI